MRFTIEEVKKRAILVRSFGGGAQPTSCRTAARSNCTIGPLIWLEPKSACVTGTRTPPSATSRAMRQVKKGTKIDAMLAAVLVFYLLVQIALFLVMTHRNSPLHECVQIADIPIAGPCH
jgi:hypothetical protein